MTKIEPTKKQLVYTIRYTVDAADAPSLEYAMDNLREHGAAEIVDVEVIAPEKKEKLAEA